MGLHLIKTTWEVKVTPCQGHIKVTFYSNSFNDLRAHGVASDESLFFWGVGVGPLTTFSDLEWRLQWILNPEWIRGLGG